MLAFVPSCKSSPAGMTSWGRHRVPFPVSLRGRAVNEMLKFVALVPRPRLINTYVKGWWKSISREPPVIGHRVRLLVEFVWSIPAPDNNSVSVELLSCSDWGVLTRISVLGSRSCEWIPTPVWVVDLKMCRYWLQYQRNKYKEFNGHFGTVQVKYFSNRYLVEDTVTKSDQNNQEDCKWALNLLHLEKLGTRYSANRKGHWLRTRSHDRVCSLRAVVPILTFSTARDYSSKFTIHEWTNGMIKLFSCTNILPDLSIVAAINLRTCSLGIKI